MSSESSDASHERFLTSRNPDHQPWHNVGGSDLCANLVHHLRGAGRDGELFALLADDRWMIRRFEHDDSTYTGFVDDLTAAWDEVAEPRVRAQIAAGEDPAALADCFRYVLIRTSLNSLASNYEPNLVAHAVATGFWPPKKALIAASNVPSPFRRAEFYAALLGRANLPTDLRRQAEAQGLAAARAARPGQRILALKALAPHLSEEMLADALHVALAIQSESAYAMALQTLAPYLSGDQLADAVAAAEVIADEWNRERVLAALTDPMKHQAQHQALANEQAAAQASLQGRQEQREAFTAALAIENEWQRATALMPLAPLLNEKLLTDMLTASQVMSDEGARALALAALAPYLSEDSLGEVLGAALAIEEDWPRARVLEALAPRLNRDLLAEGLAAARRIQDVGARAAALGVLAASLNAEKRDRVIAAALKAARATADAEQRVLNLAAIAALLSGEEQRQVVDEALTAVPVINDWWHRARALAAVTLYLSDDRLAQGLALALAIPEDGARGEALDALVPRLSREERHRVLIDELAVIRADDSDRVRALALRALAAQLSEDLLVEARAIAQTLGDERSRAESLAALAPYVGEAEQPAVLVEALAAARAAPKPSDRAHALAALAPLLSGEEQREVVAEGLAAARAQEDVWFRALDLAAFAPYLNGVERRRVVSEVLEAPGTSEEQEQLEVLMAAIGPADAEQRDQIFRYAMAMREHDAALSLLLALRGYLGDSRVIPAIRIRLVDTLRSMQGHKREDVLRLVDHHPEIFAPPVLPVPVLERLTDGIIDICTNWRWQ